MVKVTWCCSGNRSLPIYETGVPGWVVLREAQRIGSKRKEVRATLGVWGGCSTERYIKRRSLNMTSMLRPLRYAGVRSSSIVEWIGMDGEVRTNNQFSTSRIPGPTSPFITHTHCHQPR